MKKLLFTKVYRSGPPARMQARRQDAGDHGGVRLQDPPGAGVPDEVYLTPSAPWVPVRRIIH
jgi:hypothetical protein